MSLFYNPEKDIQAAQARQYVEEQNNKPPDLWAALANMLKEMYANKQAQEAKQLEASRYADTLKFQDWQKSQAEQKFGLDERQFAETQRKNLADEEIHRGTSANTAAHIRAQIGMLAEQTRQLKKAGKVSDLDKVALASLWKAAIDDATTEEERDKYFQKIADIHAKYGDTPKAEPVPVAAPVEAAPKEGLLSRIREMFSGGANSFNRQLQLPGAPSSLTGATPIMQQMGSGQPQEEDSSEAFPLPDKRKDFILGRKYLVPGVGTKIWNGSNLI